MDVCLPLWYSWRGGGWAVLIPKQSPAFTDAVVCLGQVLLILLEVSATCELGIKMQPIGF